MINLLIDKPALIIIDFQKAFDDEMYWGGERNNQNAEKNASQLLSIWRKHQLPIYHIKHCSTNPDSPLFEKKTGNDFKEEVQPLNNELVISKNVNSAFIGTNLKEKLDNGNITTVVIAGLTTDHCVSTTTRMAGNFGYKTFLVSDATACFGKKGINDQWFSAELIHEVTLASIHGEFASVLTTEMVLKNNLETFS